MTLIYHVQIIALHEFNRVVHESYHRTSEGADKAAVLALEKAQDADEPEWFDSFSIVAQTFTLHD
jgi:hypothetical protein